MKTFFTFFLTALFAGMFCAASARPASTAQFSASSYTFVENEGEARLTVQRAGDISTELGLEYATADGTATQGLKYESVAGRLIFRVGETNKVIVVPILNNGLVDGSRNFRVMLSNPTAGALLGSRTNVLVTLTDNDAGVELFTDKDTVTEDSGGVVFGVVRYDDGEFPVTVDFATTNLTATGRLDYTGVSNRLVFAPHEFVKFVTVPVLNDSLKEPNETFRVTLSNPVGVTLATRVPLTATIVDNDQGFAFEFGSYAVLEDAGAARIHVIRGTDGTNSVVTVDFASTDVTAISGSDYAGITNTLVFTAGETVKQISIPILNDGARESNKSFRLTLSNPAGGAVLSARPTASVLVVDNDSGVGFEVGSTSVWENADALRVTVLRGNDMALGTVTVDYATSNGTARAGVNYEAVSGTVVFMPQETIKTISIPILPDVLDTNSLSFRVTLGNPTGGATLGTASTTVTILDASGLTSRTVAPPLDTGLAIRSEGALNIITWSGRGQLQRADRPIGPWATVTTATNPFTVQSPVPTSFYRVTRPRPVDVHVPSSYDGRTPLPLVILLHGYGSSAANHEAYLRFGPLAQSRGFFYCYPNGTTDVFGKRFWNATDACCDYDNSGVDDAGYLRSLIEEIRTRFAVDPKRIHLVGHSNGGFMAYRMACEHSDLIAGIASLAGATFLDPGRCQPSHPVNILQIHGTADGSYPGDPFQPGARQSVQSWAGYNGAADPVTDQAPSMNLDLAVPGLETVVTRYTKAPSDGAVELWTINGGAHEPTFYSGASASEVASKVIDWLLAHPKR